MKALRRSNIDIPRFNRITLLLLHSFLKLSEVWKYLNRDALLDLEINEFHSQPLIPPPQTLVWEEGVQRYCSKLITILFCPVRR